MNLKILNLSSTLRVLLQKILQQKENFSKSIQKIPSPLACAISFLLGTFLVNQSSDACKLKIEGVLMNPSKSLSKSLQDFSGSEDLFVYDSNKECLLSEKAIRVWRQHSSDRPYLLWRPHRGESELLERLVLSKSISIKVLSQTAVICNQQGRISYGL